MKIVKFCNPQHNPLLNATRIQWCDIRYYRTTDNDFIRDLEEGEVGRSLQPPTPETITASALGKLTGLSIVGNGSISFAGNAIKTVNPIPNAYVFCTSRVASPTRQHAAVLGYESFYVITDPTRFCVIAAEELRARYNFPRVLGWHGPVSYVPEKLVRFQTVSEFFASHRTVDPTHFFLKRHSSREDLSKIYSDEQEYRFVCLPVDERGLSISLPTEKFYFDESLIRNLIASEADEGQAS